MFDEFAHTMTPAAPGGMCVKTIWFVKADHTYDVTTGGQERGTLIALRTFGGLGRLITHSGAALDLAPGTFCLFEHGDIKRYWCPGSRWDFWWFEFTATDAFQLPLGAVMTVPRSPAEETELRSCFSLVRKNRPEASALASAFLQYFIHTMIYARSLRESTQRPHRDAVERVIELMQTSPSFLTVEQMAKTACLSSRRFRQVFARATGKSPKRFYTTLRLESAGKLLQRSSLTIYEIADRFGYSSQFHFSRDFKNHFGIPPSVFRTNQRT